MTAHRRATETRQAELIDAALHIIATEGIAALTTRALAAHVGLSSGAIFRHFASLDALLDAVVARVEQVLEATLPAATLPPLARLEAFIEARSAAVAGQLGILRLVRSEQFLLALPKRGSARLAACVEQTRAFVIACLRDGLRAGDIRDDLPLPTLAPIVMGTVQMLATSHANTKRRLTEVRAVTQSLLAMLQPPVAASRSQSRQAATTPRKRVSR